MAKARAAAMRGYGRMLRTNTPQARFLRQIPGARLAHTAVLRRLETPSVVTASASGLRLLVHAEGAVGRNLLLCGSYEPLETELFLNSIIPGTTVFDVGANVGYYSLLAARAAGASGCVLSFEPHPEMFSMLCANVRLNKASNVTPVSAAISDRAGTTRLFFSTIDHGKHSLSSANASSSAEQAQSGKREHDTAVNFATVPTLRLDDISFEPGRPQASVIKIDVEGAEPLVFEGAENLLASPSPLTILVEFWPAGIARLGGDPKRMISRLDQHGFIISIIDETSRRLIQVRPEDVLGRCLASAAGQLNLHCVKR